MKQFWLWCLPLLFLPNLGFQHHTPMGTLGLADYLLIPYLVLVALATDWSGHRNVAKLLPIICVFAVWALISTLTIAIRYDYVAMFNLEFAIAKLGRFFLCGLAGLLAASAISNENINQRFHWSLLVSSITMSMSLLVLGSGENDWDALPETAARRYESANDVSIVLAILLCYTGGKLLTGFGTELWRRVATAGCLVMVLALAVSDGRGGWLAAGAGLGYLAFRNGPSKQVIMGTILAVVLAYFGYSHLPEFKVQVDRTFLGVDQPGYYEGTRTVGNLDDGGRLSAWTHELPKMVEAPVLGTGFYHRGDQTSLVPTGSHSFFIQMVLELGAVGGLLLGAVFVTIWLQAGERGKEIRGEDVACKAALTAVVFGALGGEYFYGGVTVIVFFLIYAPIGSLLTEQSGNPDVRWATGYATWIPGESAFRRHVEKAVS